MLHRSFSGAIGRTIGFVFVESLCGEFEKLSGLIRRAQSGGVVDCMKLALLLRRFEVHYK